MRAQKGYARAWTGQVHYRRWGEGSPVVLIHQAPWSSVQFVHAGPLIAAAGFSAFAFDLPGMGLSDPAPEQPSIDDFARAIGDAIDDLGLGPAAVVGHHTGALTAGRLSAARPDRVLRLILHGAPLYTAEERRERRSRPHAEPAPLADGRHFTERWAHLGRIAGHAMSDEARHMAVLTYFNNGPLEWHAHAASYAYDFHADIGAIRCPTLILASREDPIFHHGERARAHIAGAQLQALGGGSAVIYDQAAEWATAVGAFLTPPVTTERDRRCSA